MIQLGIYRHYKGPLYQVLGVAHDANADTLGDTAVDTSGYEWQTAPYVKPFGERTVVVYIALELDGAHLGPRMAVRTLEDFEAWVQLETGATIPASSIDLADEPVYQRFTYLGPVLTEEMVRSRQPVEQSGDDS